MREVMPNRRHEYEKLAAILFAASGTEQLSEHGANDRGCCSYAAAFLQQRIVLAQLRQYQRAVLLEVVSTKRRRCRSHPLKIR
jgi:hypothetical protein